MFKFSSTKKKKKITNSSILNCHVLLRLFLINYDDEYTHYYVYIKNITIILFT